MPATLLRRMVPTLVTLLYNIKMFVKVHIDKETTGISDYIVVEFNEMIDFGIERLTTHPLENYNAFLRELAKAQDKFSTLMRIVARSNMTKNFLIKHEIDVTKKGRANVGGLKISEFFGEIDDLPEDVSAKYLVNAAFIVEEITHPKANIDNKKCNVNAFVIRVSAKRCS